MIIFKKDLTEISPFPVLPTTWKFPLRELSLGDFHMGVGRTRTDGEYLGKMGFCLTCIATLHQQCTNVLVCKDRIFFKLQRVGVSGCSCIKILQILQGDTEIFPGLAIIRLEGYNSLIRLYCLVYPGKGLQDDRPVKMVLSDIRFDGDGLIDKS